MAEKRRPNHEIRFGEVRATIWANDTSSGERWFCVITNRQYKDAQGQWQEARSFAKRHLPDLAKAIGAADQWIELQSDNQPIRVIVNELKADGAANSRKTVRRAS